MQANISTKLLQAFLALHDCRHFGHAAQRCHVSQSAFSVMIQKLEAAAGARLFERDTRNVTLTPEGQLFVEVARGLMSDIEAAFANMSDYVARRKGRVSIAALPSLAAGWLPPVLAAYRRQHPGVTVALFDAISDQCLHLLRQGKADIALTAPGPNLTEFDTQPLCQDPFYLVCRRDHPLAKKRRITLAGLIESGLGVSLVPELTLFQFRHPNLTAIALNAPQLVRPLLIVKPKERSLSIAAQGLLALILEKSQQEKSRSGKSS